MQLRPPFIMLHPLNKREKRMKDKVELQTCKVRNTINQPNGWAPKSL